VVVLETCTIVLRSIEWAQGAALNLTPSSLAVAFAALASGCALSVARRSIVSSVCLAMFFRFSPAPFLPSEGWSGPGGKHHAAASSNGAPSTRCTTLEQRSRRLTFFMTEIETAPHSYGHRERRITRPDPQRRTAHA
jgi:hypothetical protein